MAETLVKEKVCNACGAEVRPQAVFCYNCGSAVAPDIPLGGNKTQKISDDWFKGDLTEDKPEKIISEEIEIEEAEAIEPVNEIRVEEVSESQNVDEIVEEAEVGKRDLSKMDSAANLRRRSKSIQKKRVEVVWEEHDNAPNGWFIFFAILLAALAVGIWLVSKYLE